MDPVGCGGTRREMSDIGRPERSDHAPEPNTDPPPIRRVASRGMFSKALNGAVSGFVDDLTRSMIEVYAPLGTVDEATARGDVALEASKLTAAFIDCDGRHSDDQLWAYIATFAPLLDTGLSDAVPQDVRNAGLIDGTAGFVAQPSEMFVTLVRYDDAHRTDHARTYYQRAMRIAHTTASLDAHTSPTELIAIEKFRSLLLDQIRSRPERTPSPAAQPAGAGPPAGQDDAAEPLTPPRPLDDLLAELDELIGLEGVKAEVKLVANLLQVQALRLERGLPVLDTSRHLVFTGNPGTGKTTVARLLSEIYRSLEVVEKGHLVEIDRAGLVVGYVGQTAARVTDVFDRADEGLLLIDEAYTLARGGEKDFGREAIDTIVKLMEDRRDSIVLIVAGYPEEMETFIAANPGLRSRFPKTIHFPDYSPQELVEIFELHSIKKEYHLDDEARTKVEGWLSAQTPGKGFGNGRVARNLFEAAAANQATRIVTISDPTDDQLTTLVAPDIPDLVPPGASL